MAAVPQLDTPEGAANLALAHLRQPPIAQLDDEDDRARAAAATFAAARRATLRLRWWNFATGWQNPAAAAGIVRPGPLKTVYPLPADCLEVRYVQYGEADEWAVEAFKADPSGSEAEVSVLVTNLSAPLICYTRDIETVRLWNSDFLVAFSYQLAAFAGPQLGASASRVAALQNLAEAWREESAQIDAREKAPTQVSRNTSWIGARRRGGFGAR